MRKHGIRSQQKRLSNTQKIQITLQKIYLNQYFLDGHFCFEENIYKESKRKIIEDLIGVERFNKVLLPNLSTMGKYTCFHLEFSIPITEEEALYIKMKELPLDVVRIDNFNPIIINQLPDQLQLLYHLSSSNFHHVCLKNLLD